MWQEDRLLRIRGLLTTFQRVTGDRIVAELGVSRETVRRDLIELETRGELRRVHGGAVQIDGEPPLAERAHTRVRFKRAIARLAAHEAKSGQTLFLDAGSTASVVAEELATLSGLTVITNSFDVAQHMNAGLDRAQRCNRVIVLGGYLGDRLPATFGDVTITEIHRYRADIALLSPVGVDARHGATSFDHGEAEVARAMATNARRVVILADYSKIGLKSRVSYCPSERIDRLITNSKAADRPALVELRCKVAEVSLAD